MGSLGPCSVPGESQGQRSLVGCRLWSHTESDTTDVTQQQQQHIRIYVYLSIYIYICSHASKVMLKILQARLQQYVNRELPDAQAGFTNFDEFLEAECGTA